MTDNQLPEELNRVTVNVLSALEGVELSMAVIALVNSVAFLIQQMPEENHELAINNTTDMLMNLMGFMEIDPDELANATRH
jgi:uncharacterized membrane protein YozB (DUF420 family)